MEDHAVNVEAKVEDGVVSISATADVVEILKDMAKKSDNTIDDGLVAIVEAARGNMDWKGVAKGYL